MILLKHSMYDQKFTIIKKLTAEKMKSKRVDSDLEIQEKKRVMTCSKIFNSIVLVMINDTINVELLSKVVNSKAARILEYCT